MSSFPSLRRIFPLVISLGLLAWLIASVSPAALVEAASEVNWQALLPATAVMVLALYLWDSACLPAVYRVGGNRWGYGRSLRLRGVSYLGAALNYELGQAALAWGMSKQQGTSLLRMFSRSLLLAYHDVVVLLGLGLAGSMLSDDPRAARIRPIVIVGLVAAGGLALLLRAIPSQTPGLAKRREFLLTDWTLWRSLTLIPMRIVYFGILIVYAAVALQICRISVDGHVVFGTVPLVLLADGLPSIAGLGTRETALQMLLNPPQPEVLLAMSLVWTTGLITGRAAIGLGHLWWNQFSGDSTADT